MSQCFAHPETEAVGYCRQCGKALCAECRHDVRGVLYCEDCLAATVAAPPVATASPPDAPSPGIALALAFIPGVGAIYNGEYMKALTFILIYGGTISALSSGAARGLEPLLGMFLAGFYVYMIIDSYRVAKARASGQIPSPEASWQMPGTPSGSEKATPIGPLVLIVLGVIFLGNTLDLFPFGFLTWRFWPVALMAIGAYMLWQRTVGAGRKRE